MLAFELVDISAEQANRSSGKQAVDTRVKLGEDDRDQTTQRNRERNDGHVLHGGQRRSLPTGE